MQYSKATWLTTAAMSLLLASTIGSAKVSQEEADKLGNELTPVGANPEGNADGTIPAWQGEAVWPDEVKNFTHSALEEVRQGIVKYQEENPNLNLLSDLKDIEQAIFDQESYRALLGSVVKKVEKDTGQKIDQDKLDPEKMAEQYDTSQFFPKFTITHDNLDQYKDKLSAGHKQLFESYDDYKMIVYPTVRGAYYPEEIYEATKKNATRATLEGTDGVDGARVGFPYPIPKNGAQAIWNHKLKFRGSAAKRYNDQAVVDADGSAEITKVVEDVGFEYGNLNKSGEERDHNMIAFYLQETIAPPRVAGQFTLVHEIFGKGTSGRNAWIYNPGLGRVNRAPDVGYDNPSIGSDNLQFNDQVNMFNGSLSRYNWKLIGKKEMYIPYNSLLMNNPIAKYKEDFVQEGHTNQNLARYELHRVWVVEATLRDGVRHQFAKRRYYIDEDSWGIVMVDNYDNRGELWRFQEGHALTAPFIPTTTTAPETIYDLQSGRYFVTAMSNEGNITDWEVSYDEGYFSPSALKRRARMR